MGDPTKLIDDIHKIVQTLGEQEMDTLSGDTLSRLAVKIASYKASLGVHVVEANKQVLDAEAAYTLAKAEGYKKAAEEKGVTAASELKHLYAQEALKTLNDAKYVRDRVTQLSKDCHDLIDGIKSRLINLMTEKSAERVF